MAIDYQYKNRANGKAITQKLIAALKTVTKYLVELNKLGNLTDNDVLPRER